MRGLRRSIGIGAALASLALSTSVGTPGAAAQAPATAAVEEAPANLAVQDFLAEPPVVKRHRPSEVTGPAASINAMRSGRLKCGQVITRNTTLTADVGPCPSNGIIIGADNIVLNLNGHRVFGTPQTGDGVGVRTFGRSNVTITGQPGSSGRTGTVTAFDTGIEITGGAGNAVTNLVVADNDATDPSVAGGIVLVESSGNTVSNNIVSRTTFYGFGLFGPGADDNTVQANVIEESSGDHPQGAGALLLGGFRETNRNNALIGNTIRGNDGFGIDLRSEKSYVVRENALLDNGVFGVAAFLYPNELDPNQSGLIEANEVHGNAFGGILIGSGANRVINNDATGNSANYGTDLRDVSIREDRETGQLIEDCDANVWEGNTWGFWGHEPNGESFGGEPYGAYYPECVGADSANGTGPRPGIEAFLQGG